MTTYLRQKHTITLKTKEVIMENNQDKSCILLKICIDVPSHTLWSDALNGFVDAMETCLSLSPNEVLTREQVLELIIKTAEKLHSHNGKNEHPPPTASTPQKASQQTGPLMQINTWYTKEQLNWFDMAAPIIDSKAVKRSYPSVVIYWLMDQLRKETMSQRGTILDEKKITEWYVQAAKLVIIGETAKTSGLGMCNKERVDWVKQSISCIKKTDSEVSNMGFARTLITWGMKRFPNEKSLRMFIEGRGEPPFSLLLVEPGQNVTQVTDIMPTPQDNDRGLTPPIKITDEFKPRTTLIPSIPSETVRKPDTFKLPHDDYLIIRGTFPFVSKAIGHPALIGETIDYFLMEFNNVMQKDEKKLKILFRNKWEKVSTGKTNPVEFSYVPSIKVVNLLEPLRSKLNSWAQKQEELVSWTALVRLMAEWMRDEDLENIKTLRAYFVKSQGEHHE